MAGPTTVHNGGRAATPAGGAALATIPFGSLPKGKYLIRLFPSVSVGAEVGNIEYREGATAILAGLGSLSGEAVELIRELDGATAISCNATGAAGASEYAAAIVAKKL